MVMLGAGNPVLLCSVPASRAPWGATGPTLPASLSLPFTPNPMLSTHAHTLTSAALGLLPWVLPELFVSPPPCWFPPCLPPLHLSFHPSLLLSLSFVPRNSCPVYCLIGILCTMGSHRGGPLSSVCLCVHTYVCACVFK